MKNSLHHEQIAQGIYWVGVHDHALGLHCNPYLLVDGDEAVLIDPGSVLDFEYIYKNVSEIVDLSQVKYVILHHQDPDLCSSVPLFEQKGCQFTVVTHWRTQVIAKYYGIQSNHYIVDEHQYCLTLKSGRELNFIHTPYLHFSGAITTYDSKSKILFSSDLFGAFSYEWKLYADESYIEQMKVFHEHYMPSNDILRPVMEIFSGMDIKMIAPQHGSIIKEPVHPYIHALKNLQCGIFLNPIKQSLAKSGGLAGVCSAVLKRYYAIFKTEEVLEAIEALDLELDQETLEIIDYNYTGNSLWELIFEEVYAKKGAQWLTVIEPLVDKLAKEYDLPVPKVFNSLLKKAEEQAFLLNSENAQLKEINERLQQNIVETQEKLTKCPVTGLYNDVFFRGYLKSEMDQYQKTNRTLHPTLIMIDADQLSRIRFSYGDDEVDSILRGIAYILNSFKRPNDMVFRLQGASFAFFMPDCKKEDATKLAERQRNAIESSDQFIQKITASLGVVRYDEILAHENAEFWDAAKTLHEIALMRVRLAKSMGMNLVCSQSSIESYQDEIGKILVVDDDRVNVDVLKTFLENLHYKVITTGDGEEALKMAEQEHPHLIIAEIMTPKLDGFMLKEKLDLQSAIKDTVFILISHLKDEDSVKRAANLGIEHYFKKPYMLSELLGIIKNKVKGDAFL